MANQIALIHDKDSLKGILGEKGFQESLRAVANRYMSVERVAKVAMLAASRQPRLYSCTALSFLQSVVKAAELGLEFGGATGQGYLVPYKNGRLSASLHREVYECQFIPGYRGFIELAYRSGHVTFIDAQLVYEKDLPCFDYGFNYGADSSPFIRHKPFMGGDRGKVVCAYSVIMLKDSTLPKIDFMSADELEQIRQCSKSKDDGPWVTFPGEMQKKSILRRSIKWIRTTPELVQAEEADNVDYDLSGTTIIDADHELGTEGCKRRLAAAIGQQGPTEPEGTVEGPTEPQGDPVEPEPAWLCDDGHAFDQPDKKGKKQVCPVCGTDQIGQLSKV